MNTVPSIHLRLRDFGRRERIKGVDRTGDISGRKALVSGNVWLTLQWPGVFDSMVQSILDILFVRSSRHTA